MKFEKGDIVRYIEGKVDWEVKHGINMGGTLGADGPPARYYIIESGMSGRRYTAWEHELKPWVPGD